MLRHHLNVSWISNFRGVTLIVGSIPIKRQAFLTDFSKNHYAPENHQPILWTFVYLLEVRRFWYGSRDGLSREFEDIQAVNFVILTMFFWIYLAVLFNFVWLAAPETIFLLSIPRMID